MQVCFGLCKVSNESYEHQLLSALHAVAIKICGPPISSLLGIRSVYGSSRHEVKEYKSYSLGTAVDGLRTGR